MINLCDNRRCPCLTVTSFILPFPCRIYRHIEPCAVLMSILNTMRMAPQSHTKSAFRELGMHPLSSSERSIGGTCKPYHRMFQSDITWIFRDSVEIWNAWLVSMEIIHAASI